MGFFRRYLTAGNYLSWPVVAISTLILLTGHLFDIPLNGTENVPERAGLLLAHQVLFFGVVWGCDRLFLSRIPEAFRWLAVWGTITVLAAVWGLVFAWALWQFELMPEFDSVPRIRGWILNLAMMSVLVAMMYGIVAESASHQRQRQEIATRLAQLNSLNERRQEADASVIADLRSQLEATLAPEPLDSAEKTLGALRSAIDEIIRPVIRMLNDQVTPPITPHVATRPLIQWGRIAGKFGDYAQRSIILGVVLFAMSIILPLSRLLGLGEAMIVVSLIAVQLSVTTFLMTKLTRFLPGTMQAAAFPLVLVASAAIGGVLFAPVIAWGEPWAYYLGFIIRYTVLGMVPVLMAIAVDENRQTSALIAKDQADLTWALARTNEVHHHHNRLITSAVHGRWQAVLVAAAARLQIAIREGVSTEEAVALARNEAGQLSLQNLGIDEAPPSLADAVHEAVSLWEGVAEIVWNPKPGVIEHVDYDPVCSRLCAELILELCTNAIKHANASEIEVSLSKVGHRVVRVVVRNNGEPYRSDQPGYGSSLLGHSCVRWSVTQDDGVTVVSADVPWSAGENPIPA
jgi:signal transduction histidine kinase